MRLEIVQFDTDKPVESVLSDEDGPAPLLGAQVRWRMRPAPKSGLTLPALDVPATIVNENAVLGDPDYGKVRYYWQPGDTDVWGIFHGQWNVTFSLGGEETFPSDGYIEVVILKSLAP